MDTSLGNRIAIVQAMSALIEETTLDKMGVSAICERAGLSRATFYRLFSCKYDVLQWLISVYSEAGLDEIGRSLTWHEGLARTTKGLNLHAKLLFAANSTKQPFEAPREFTFAKRRDVLVETIKEWHHVELTPRLAFQVRSYARLSAIVASEWHRGLYPYSEHEYIDLVESIVPCDLRRLLDTPVAPEKPGSRFSLFDAQKPRNHLAKAMLNMIGEEGDGR